MSEEGQANRAAAGAANLAAWKEKHPSGGNLKHGKRSRIVRRKFTDLRTREGKDLAATMQELADDLGPISPGQKIILKNLAAKLAVTRAIAAWIDRQPSVVVKGELLPILATSFVAYTGAIQRGVLALYDLAGKRPHRTVDLQSYIEGKRAGKKEAPPPGNGSGE
jgi:hypothetical protein